MSAVPHCPNCGYNLTGLDLPRRCPECGHLADAVAEREAAVCWYSSWNGLLFRKTPPMALAYIGDARCRRHAWRRCLLLVLAPWLAVTLLFLLINSVQEVKTHETWWERPENPSQKLYYKKTADTDRLLTLNLDLLGLRLFDFSHISGAVRREKTTRSFVLSWPEPDAFTCLVFLVPPAVSVFGVWFLAGVLRVRRAMTRQTGPSLGAGAAWPLAVLLGPWLTAALGIHALSGGCWAMIDAARQFTSEWGDAFGVLIWVALGIYGVGGVSVVWRAVRVSRGHRPALFTWVALALLSAAWAAAVAGVWALTVVIVELLD